MLERLLKSKIFWVQIISLVTGILAYLDLSMLEILGISNSPKVFVIIGLVNTFLTALLRGIQGTSADVKVDKFLATPVIWYPLDCIIDGVQVFCYELTEEEQNSLPINYDLPVDYIAFGIGYSGTEGSYITWDGREWQIGGGGIGLPRKKHT